MKDNAREGEARRNNNRKKRRRPDAPVQAHHAQGSDSGKKKAQAKKPQKSKKSVFVALVNEARLERRPVGNVQRLKWVAPELPKVDLEPEICVLCEKPIDEFATVVSDHESGRPAHFDCAVNRIAEREHLEEGDRVGYIGGGRFGIIKFDNPGDPKKFKIKKILEWEKKGDRSKWRTALSEHFSGT
ncbi:MAG: hypothetical protein FWD94_00525 [Treponema sp.]|nr:hypothetical protein [Treponema sp.]